MLKFPFRRAQPLPMATTLNLGNITIFIKIRRHSIPPENHGTILSEILGQSRAFSSENPTDRVFAVLGLSERVIDSKERTWPVRTGYTRTTRDIFVDTVKYIISSAHPVSRPDQQPSRCFEILWQVEDRSFTQITDLPTWLADFSVDCSQPFSTRS
jgi:hypothetical protein